nr:hypothetical protein BaRGS_032600 [Batillaria attramentaria]
MSECPDGYYGINCRHHCHCAEKEECGRDVADCGSGCEDGWTGPTCQSQSVSPRGWQIYVTEYSDFYWATPCATVRADGPHVQMTCDSPVTGKYLTLLNTQGAVAVCELQASGVPTSVKRVTRSLDDASQAACPACPQGTWGLNCSKACGSCQKNAPCDPITGRCPGACADHFSGDRCEIREVFEDSSSGEAPVTLMAVVLSVVLTVLLLVLVCLALKWRRDKYLVDL